MNAPSLLTLVLLSLALPLQVKSTLAYDTIDPSQVSQIRRFADGQLYAQVGIWWVWVPEGWPNHQRPRQRQEERPVPQRPRPSAAKPSWAGVVLTTPPAGLSNGAYIEKVCASGPAMRAGLRPGDTIVAWDERAISTTDQLLSIVGQAKPGTTIPVRVIRAGQPSAFEVLTEARPSDSVIENLNYLGFDDFKSSTLDNSVGIKPGFIPPSFGDEDGQLEDKPKSERILPRQLPEQDRQPPKSIAPTTSAWESAIISKIRSTFPKGAKLGIDLRQCSQPEMADRIKAALPEAWTITELPEDWSLSSRYDDVIGTQQLAGVIFCSRLTNGCVRLRPCAEPAPAQPAWHDIAKP